MKCNSWPKNKINDKDELVGCFSLSDVCSVAISAKLEPSTTQLFQVSPVRALATDNPSSVSD